MLDEEQQLILKLRKIEALFARPGTDGERRAAESASNRIRAHFEVVTKRVIAQARSVRMPATSNFGTDQPSKPECDEGGWDVHHKALWPLERRPHRCDSRSVLNI